MTELEQTLSEALSFARVPELPEDVSKTTGTWTKAIVLVKKANNRQNYAIAHNDGSGGARIVKDFGPTYKIVDVLGIFPYSFVSLQYQPNLKTKEDIVMYLVNHGEKEAEVRKLISDIHPNKKEKSAQRKMDDKAKLKALVMKYTIADENELKKRENEAINTAFYEKNLPEIESAEWPENKEEKQ